MTQAEANLWEFVVAVLVAIFLTGVLAFAVMIYFHRKDTPAVPLPDKWLSLRDE